MRSRGLALLRSLCGRAQRHRSAYLRSVRSACGSERGAMRLLSLRADCGSAITVPVRRSGQGRGPQVEVLRWPFDRSRARGRDGGCISGRMPGRDVGPAVPQEEGASRVRPSPGSRESAWPSPRPAGDGATRASRRRRPAGAALGDRAQASVGGSLRRFARCFARRASGRRSPGSRRGCAPRR